MTSIKPLSVSSLHIINDFIIGVYDVWMYNYPVM